MLWLFLAALYVLFGAGVIAMLMNIAVRLRIHTFAIFRFCNFRVLAVSLLLLSFPFGMGTGYFYAWLDPQRGEHSCRVGLYDALSEMLAGPGCFIANQVVNGGADMQDGEIELFSRDIQVWNGFFWVTVSGALAVVAYSLKRQMILVGAPPSGQPGQLGLTASD